MTRFATVLRTLGAHLSSVIAPPNKRRLWVLVAGLLAIAVWQSSFRQPDAKIDNTYRLTASTGISYENRFFFFLYHLNLYPLMSDAPIKADTKAEAERLLHESPELLKQDDGVTFRGGDRGRAYLYFVDAWQKKNSLKPSLKPAHALAFLTVLALLFGSFWWIRRPLFGLGLVVLFGSNPFQLHSVYGEDNIFSWSITALILVLAIHVPLLGKDPQSGKYPWVAALITGIAMATIRTVRSEPMPVLAGAMLAYVTLAGAPRWKRAALTVLLLVSFTVSNSLSAKLVERKFEKSRTAIREVGGIPYEGPLALYHEFWHPMFCGLGDFDKGHGYVWDDRTAYRFAAPRLQAMHGEKVAKATASVLAGGWGQVGTYDQAGKYPIFFSEIPGYHDIIREKVLGDIKSDPIWYLGILVKRVGRILTDTTPVSISFSKEQFQTKSSLLGILCVPLLAFLVITRRQLYAKLLAMSATTSIAALLVFSDRGMTYYGCYHIVGAAIFASLALEGARQWLRRSAA